MRSPETDVGAAQLLDDVLAAEPLLAGVVGRVASWDTTVVAAQQICQRQHEAGRRLLATVMRAADIGQDAWRVEMPHPRLSLSHTDGIVAAVGCRGSAAPGVGIDIERHRAVDLRSARFFLDRRERARWLDGAVAPAAVSGVLQLWTVKEAVFKADLGNAGHQLMDYRIRSLHLRADRNPLHPNIIGGTAERAGRLFHFASASSADLLLSVARSVPPPDRPAIPERNSNVRNP